MKMKEENTNNIAKKIRNQLIYFIHLELMKKMKCHQNILINSMTSKELNDKYQKFSDYCVEKVETYSSSQINYGSANSNYYHISITYCSLNNNYNMIIDNKSTEKMIETNNIIGKYYKGDTVNIRTISKNNNYKISYYAQNYINSNFNKNENESNLEKIVIGNKKFLKNRKLILSSFQITKNLFLNERENINNHCLNNVNSNQNNNHKKINSNINENNIKNVETNFEHKFKRSKNQKIIRIYTTKLKNYCSNLKILKKKVINHLNHQKHQKLNESSSPATKNSKKDNMGKEKSKNHVPTFICKDYKDKETNNSKNKTYIQNKLLNQSIRTNIKNHTKINDKKNPVKILDKKAANRNRAQSIDKIVEKTCSTKKMASPKKIINSVGVNNEKKLVSSLFHKHKKNKGHRGSNSINKNVSSGIIRKRKFFNHNSNFKSYNIFNNNNEIPLSNGRLNSALARRANFKTLKRANTGININKLYNFRGNEIKLKESSDD